MSVKNNYPNVRPSIGVNFARSKKIPSSINYSRPSTGTYVGADGLIKYAGVNEPRFDHNPTTGESLGLLVEEARTNLLTYSEQFDNAAWDFLITQIASRTPNAAMAPNGTLTADRITAQAAAAGPFLFRSAGSAAAHTISCYVKKDTSNWFAFSNGGYLAWFNIETGALGTIQEGIATIASAGDGWYKCSWTPVTLVFNNAWRFRITTNNNSSAANGESLFLWGAQLEAGAFPTSYIPTTSATVTRNADTLTVPSSILNPSKFSIRIETESAVNKAPAFSLNNGTAFNETKLLLYPTAGGSRLIQNGNIVRDGLVLNLDVGNPASYPSGSGYYYRAWSGGWSGYFANATNSFDGNLSTSSGGAGGTFSATYTFSGGLNVSGTVRVYVVFGANSGQVNGRTGVILVDGIDISSKMAAANLYGTAGWVDVTSEVGSIFNTIVLNGTSGSTNPGIYAIEVNGQILIDNTTLIDLSGNGNNGTLTNAPTYSSANGGSIVFDGVDDRVNVSSSALGLSSGTLCFWIKSGTLRDIYNTHSGDWNQNTLWGEGTNLILIISNGTPNPGGVVISSSLVFDNNFHFVCTQWTTGGERSIWLDGTKRASLTNTLQYVPSSTFEVGYKSWSASYYSGNMYNVMSYNRALTAAEISQNYNALRGRYSI